MQTDRQTKFHTFSNPSLHEGFKKRTWTSAPSTWITQLQPCLKTANHCWVKWWLDVERILRYLSLWASIPCLQELIQQVVHIFTFLNIENAIWFFVGSTAVFLLYHLAQNPDKQEILYKEIVEMVGAEGRLTEAALSKMKYIKV